MLGNSETQLEQFAANAFGAPEPILPCHLLDQRDGLRSQFWTPTAITRFEFPEEAESLTAPTKESVGFEDEQGFLPVLDMTGKKDEPEAIGLRKGGLFDLAVQDDQLLAEESILGNEVGFAACEVCGGTEHNGVTGGLGEIERRVQGEKRDGRTIGLANERGWATRLDSGKIVKNYQRSVFRVLFESNPGRMGFSATTAILLSTLLGETPNP